jgi:hypothetical protein
MKKQLAGTVYDVDYIEKAKMSQVAVKPDTAEPGGALHVKSALLQSILEVAVRNASTVELTYEDTSDKMIVVASVSVPGQGGTPPPAPLKCGSEECVRKVECTAGGRCTAVVQVKGADVTGHTTSALAAALLASGLDEQRGVEEFQVDASGLITRVKINNSSTPAKSK